MPAVATAPASPVLVVEPLVSQVPPGGDDQEAAQWFLISVPVGRERHVIGVGVYVPPRIEVIDFDDLTPAEQDAVRHGLASGNEQPFQLL
jgi:hypothetical protein